MIPGLIHGTPASRPSVAEVVVWALTLVAVVIGVWFVVAGTPVAAVVRETDPDGDCRVAWDDSRTGRPRTGRLLCSPAQAGDSLPVQVLGAPVEGTLADDTVAAWAVGSGIAFPLAIALTVRARRRRAPDASPGRAGPRAVAMTPVPVPATIPSRGTRWSARTATAPPRDDGPRDDAQPVAAPRPDTPDRDVRARRREPVDVHVAVRIPRLLAAPVSGPRADATGSAAVPAVRATLERLGFIGGVVDGAAVDAPGWVIATTMGWDDGTMVRWVPGRAGAKPQVRPDLAWDAVRRALAIDLRTDVQVGRHVVLDGRRYPTLTGVPAVPEVENARSGPVHQVAVGWWERAEISLVAATVGAPLVVARVDGVVLLQLVDPAGPGDLLPAVAWARRRPAVLLWSMHRFAGFLAMRRSALVLDHAWHAPWVVVDPSRSVPGAPRHPVVEELVSTFTHDPEAAAALASAFGIRDPGRVRELGAVLAAEPDPTVVARLRAALELPAVIDDVLAGRRSLAAVHGAYVQEPVPLVRGALRAAAADAWGAGTQAAPQPPWWSSPPRWAAWRRVLLVVLGMLGLVPLQWASGVPVLPLVTVTAGVVGSAALWPRGRSPRQEELPSSS